MLATIVINWRKLIRRLNWRNWFVELDREQPALAVLAGYTRSGTTYLGRMLSNLTGARPIHEPLNPKEVGEVAFFSERESSSLIENSERHQKALRLLFSPDFAGCKYTNNGNKLVYRQRLYKLVRANHYIGYISDLLPATPFVVIIRNPCACISSRIRAGWPVPDHSQSIGDIAPLLSKEQLDLYYNAENIVERLAVSWCLDNFMLLKNVQNARFLYVSYESLVQNPLREFSRILEHIGRSGDLQRLERELELESGGESAVSYLDKWKDSLGPRDIERVKATLRVFQLDVYYDVDAGMPTADFPT